MTNKISIRNAVLRDLDSIIAIDNESTESAKSVDYWEDIFARYVLDKREDRLFLVAEAKGFPVGFIIGEIRAWEFGSPHCGWVFALAVLPKARNMGTAKNLFEEISKRMKLAGVTTLRTMVDRDDKLTLSFFRGMGLRSGKYIELENQLD